VSLPSEGKLGPRFVHSLR